MKTHYFSAKILLIKYNKTHNYPEVPKNER